MKPVATTSGAWANSAATNEGLINNLIASKYITSDVLADAMRANDRKHFVPPPRESTTKSHRYNYGPYADAPQPLGFRATVSAPYVQALAMNELVSHISKPGSCTLDVGSGSGIMVGYMARLSSSTGGGKVVGVEVVKPLVKLSCLNLEKSGLAPNKGIQGNIEVIVQHGNGWNGLSKHGPFDAIHVGAQAETIPEELLDQLKLGGRMIIPIGPMQQAQQFTRVDKDMNGVVTTSSCGTVRFVPLVKENEENSKWTRASDKSEGVSSSGVNWDLRYRKGWAYGKDPNSFLVEAMENYIKPCMPVGPLQVLCIADGQGRNGVYCASLGCEVTSIDISPIGMKKAVLLAKQKLCCPELLKIVICDVNVWEGEVLDEFVVGEEKKDQQRDPKDKKNVIKKYDIIVDIFSSLDNEKRSERMIRWMNMLEDDGWYVNECFAPRHHKVRDGRACGPKEKNLISKEMLEKETKDYLDIVVSREVEKRINEGKFHRGPCVVTQFIGRRKSRKNISDALKGSSTLTGETFHNTMNQLFEAYAGITNSPQDIFRSYAMGSVNIINKTSNHYGKKMAEDNGSVLFVDNLLYCAEASIQVACLKANREKRCRYCWVERDQCLCPLIDNNAKKEQTSLHHDVTDISPSFTVVCHPNEYLRSTSSAKIAVRQMANSRMLVYGARTHRRHISDLAKEDFGHRKVSDENLTYVLFPEGPKERTYTVEEMIQHIKGKSNGEEKDQLKSTATAQNTPRKIEVNIIVPDGSWECCRSLVNDMERLSCNKIKYVTLNLESVKRFHSPLIEALKKGQGFGRISTLEACALLLKEMGDETSSNRLLQALVPLTNYVLEQKKKEVLSFKKPRHYSQWLEHLRRASTTAVEEGSYNLPIGLRRCTICQETLATPIRMREHVKGKKHCELVFRKYLSSIGKEKNNNRDEIILTNQPNLDIAHQVYRQFSMDVLANVSTEPPDVALVHLMKSLEEAQIRRKEMDNALTISNELNKRVRAKSQKGNHKKKASIPLEEELSSFTNTTTSITKGELLYRSGPAPKNVKSLPQSLLRKSFISFNTELIDLRSEIINFLSRSGSSFGSFPTTPHVLEEFQPSVDVFRNFNARKIVYKAVSSDEKLLSVYTNLIKEVIVPHLKALLVAEENEGDKKHTFYYQYPPTLRIQPGPSKMHGRSHRDAEYGHQCGELNFWMPLSYYSLTQTTLFVEDSPDSKKFHPLMIEYGNIGKFHGTLCHHYAPCNKSMCTRVSLDFRVGISDYFDPEWMLQGIKAQHGRKSITM
jgi:protein-L-isoaspartate(D-aspartate) O-methyltransferase